MLLAKPLEPSVAGASLFPDIVDSHQGGSAASRTFMGKQQSAPYLAASLCRLHQESGLAVRDFMCAFRRLSADARKPLLLA